MASLFESIVGVALFTTGVTGAAHHRITEPVEVVFGRADSEIALKTELFQKIFGDEHYDWDVDLEAGTIVFASATKKVSAPVQVIGTYNRLDRTFLWGWDHPSVPEPQGADARLARKYGQLHDLPLFTAVKVKCSEEQAWRFTAVALYLSGAQGAYRAPVGGAMVFMTFGQMTISPIK